MPEEFLKVGGYNIYCLWLDNYGNIDNTCNQKSMASRVKFQTFAKIKYPSKYIIKLVCSKIC